MDVPADLAYASAILRDQWGTLRAWVGDLVAADGPRLAQVPSVLAGWSVADLVAHVGRSLDALAVVTPAPDARPPLTLAQYVGGYAAGAADIAEGTRGLAVEIAADPLGALDVMARAAFDHLAALGDDRVVLARRGPVRLSVLVVSRVLELVVHADDLVRSVRPQGPAPIDPPALTLVADALVGVLAQRTGVPVVTVTDPLAWVRLACGRVPADARAAAAAVRVTARGWGASDVARLLPLL
jgi:hypothetical protein